MYAFGLLIREICGSKVLPELAGITEACLRPNREKRPKVTDLIDSLDHWREGLHYSGRFQGDDRWQYEATATPRQLLAAASTEV